MGWFGIGGHDIECIGGADYYFGGRVSGESREEANSRMAGWDEQYKTKRQKRRERKQKKNGE